MPGSSAPLQRGYCQLNLSKLCLAVKLRARFLRVLQNKSAFRKKLVISISTYVDGCKTLVETQQSVRHVLQAVAQLLLRKMQILS